MRCDFINDLQKMFRSFRVKLSLTKKYRSKYQTCHLQESMQIKRNARAPFHEVRLMRIDPKRFGGPLPFTALAQYAPEKICRICADGLRDRDKLRHVDLALIALNHPNHRVRTL